ncbi:MAG: ribbon-helix-helix domain-containing protein [bacterium]
MKSSKVAISIAQDILKEVDYLVKEKKFASRSQAIQISVIEKIDRMKHTRLFSECSKLDPDFEQALAEEGLSREVDEWPEY